jgi:hypothetical protein
LTLTALQNGFGLCGAYAARSACRGDSETPCGKRIQNKLQRDQIDHFGGGGGGGYNNEQPSVNMTLGNQCIGVHHCALNGGARHFPATPQNGPLAEVYGAQYGLYSTGGPGLQSQVAFGLIHVPSQLAAAVYRRLRLAGQLWPRSGYLPFTFASQQIFWSFRA